MMLFVQCILVHFCYMAARSDEEEQKAKAEQGRRAFGFLHEFWWLSFISDEASRK